MVFKNIFLARAGLCYRVARSKQKLRPDCLCSCQFIIDYAGDKYSNKFNYFGMARESPQTPGNVASQSDTEKQQPTVKRNTYLDISHLLMVIHKSYLQCSFHPRPVESSCFSIASLNQRVVCVEHSPAVMITLRTFSLR